MDVDRTKTLERVLKLKKFYEEGRITTLATHEVNPGLDKSDRIHYIYFTLPVALNFQRSSPAMWQSALKTFNDPETNYLFYPEKIVLQSREKIQKDLTKHKLALQKNKHTDIWITISRTLYEKFDSDPKNIFKTSQNCVTRIKNLLQIEMKKDFPYLSGIKMSNYWLYILSHFTDIKLRNKHKISIIPDTHVIQCTIKLGLANTGIKPNEVENLWFDLLKNSEIIPYDMHAVLWNWSRAGFSPEV